MNIFGAVMRGLQLLPALITGFEGVFGKGSGATKKEKVLEASSLIMGATEFIASKDIVDDEAFLEGQKEAIDAIVKMFNASIWHKSKQQQ